MQEALVSQADDSKISEDRREALRYALAIGSGAALASAISSPAAAVISCLLPARTAWRSTSRPRPGRRR